MLPHFVGEEAKIPRQLGILQKEPRCGRYSLEPSHEPRVPLFPLLRHYQYRKISDTETTKLEKINSKEAYELTEPASS